MFSISTTWMIHFPRDFKGSRRHEGTPSITSLGCHRYRAFCSDQQCINKTYEWSKKWKLEFNAKKCHIMELGKCKRRLVWNYLMEEEQIMKTKEGKDLGVIIQENQNSKKHISKIFGLAYKMLTPIKE
ncbi:hypothetical protein E2C01_042095 [Portunus trituberculatus]|uniref:Reverse transcriptase domain-containing protein n=1 Tax=Portunus trituberculatus TaxID=210409 RepID=A0A5B7FSH4_PORTR|nr:hypothetical protein [Portunus trituberculatus]